jgi:hypothetical protein
VVGGSYREVRVDDADAAKERSLWRAMVGHCFPGGALLAGLCQRKARRADARGALPNAPGKKPPVRR